MNVFVQLESDLVRLEECQRGMGVDKVASISWQGEVFFPRKCLEIIWKYLMKYGWIKLFPKISLLLYGNLFIFLNVHGFQNIKTYFKILGGKSGHCSRPLRGFRLVELVQCAALLNILYIQYFSMISIAISLHSYIRI